MSQKIRLPSIHAGNPADQLQQMRSYLYQLANQLNWLLDDLSQNTAASTAGSWSLGDVHLLFSQLRPLMIRSTEISDAYRERYQGFFAAVKDMPTVKTHVWTDAGELTVQSRFEEFDYMGERQNFLVFGCVGGVAVLESWTLTGDGCLVRTGTVPALPQPHGRLTVSGAAGDSLTILSSDSFSFL